MAKGGEEERRGGEGREGREGRKGREGMCPLTLSP